MSQQQVEHGRYRISFGWDRPFDSYFALVEDTDDEAEEPLLWLGSAPGEYRDLETFGQSLAKALMDVGINDWVITDRHLIDLQAARNESPPGAGVAEKTPAMRDLMNIFRGDPLS